jgi:hypothetical protein
VAECPPFSSAEGSLVDATLKGGLKVLHLVRDPRSLLLARIQAPRPGPVPLPCFMPCSGTPGKRRACGCCRALVVFEVGLESPRPFHPCASLRGSCGSRFQVQGESKADHAARVTGSQGAGGGGKCGNIAASGVVECTKWQCNTVRASGAGIDRILRQVVVGWHCVWLVGRLHPPWP